jgi:flagellar protein FlaG
MDVTMQPGAGTAIPTVSAAERVRAAPVHGPTSQAKPAPPTPTASPVGGLPVASAEVAPQARGAAKAAEPSAAEVKAAAAKVSNAMSLRSPDAMEFATDKDTGKSVVRIVDTKTGKLIQQIPSEQVLEMAKSIDKMQGLLLDHKA